jgi:hypothetical protein
MSWISSFVGRFSGDYHWPVLGDCRGLPERCFPALWAYSGPRTKIAGRRELFHVSANFSNKASGRHTVYPWNCRPRPHCLLKRADLLLNLLIKRFEFLFERVQ